MNRAALKQAPIWLAVAAGGLLGPRLAPAEKLDPSVPLRLEAAPPKGPAVASRLDLEGSSRSRVALPKQPAVRFQKRLPGPILGAPVANARGELVVAHGNGRVSAVDAAGHTTWTLRPGGDLLGAPILIGSGRTLVVTRDAEVVSISGDGRELSREKLPFGELEGALVASPTLDGGAIVASGARFARVNARASPSLFGSAASAIVAAFDWRGTTLLVEREGRVLTRAPALEASEIGRFGGPVTKVALSGDRLFALVGDRELAALDLRTSESERRYGEPAADLRDFALGVGGTAHVLGSGGVLVELDAGGRERSRLSLLPDGAGGEASSIIADDAGTVLVVIAGAPIVLVPSGGEARSVPGTGCPDPLRPTPVAPGLVVTGCRSGVLRALSDRAR